MKLKLIKDKYRRARGGTSTFYRIYCQECLHTLGEYQKDGKGLLMRLYQDRFNPATKQVNARKGHCTCSNWFGVPYSFKPENRPAIKLFIGKIYKRKLS